MSVDLSALRNALAQDQGFIGRLAAVMAKIAVQVINENVNTVNHVVRLAYAKKVVQNQNSEAARAAMFVLFLDNFVGATIEVVPESNGRFAVRCSTADADADSQISTSWDKLAELFG